MRERQREGGGEEREERERTSPSMWQLQKDSMIKAAKGSLWLRNQNIPASPTLT